MVTVPESQSVSWRQSLRLLASPLLDESGSPKSITAGLFSLFMVGSVLGLVSTKNEDLPTAWYRYISAMIGYIYFLCWSVSFYPQVISNFKRQSTSGLSTDFCSLNVVGFACYTIYNASLFWSPTIRQQYRERYGSEVTVESNDVAFAVHALLLSSITLGQIVYYRDGQRPSTIFIVIIALVLVACLSFPLLVWANVFIWLDYAYALSFVKIGISLIKYLPQVVLNYRRQSTAGWSIWNILLDFTGGVLSDTQLVLDCADMKDFSGITGNLAKFGLGFVSMFFDIIFMVQHYCLYAHPAIGTDVGGTEHDPLLPNGEDLEGERPVEPEISQV